jgi:tetratricopeptide (TPR) repeat protein
MGKPRWTAVKSRGTLEISPALGPPRRRFLNDRNFSAGILFCFLAVFLLASRPARAQETPNAEQHLANANDLMKQDELELAAAQAGAAIRQDPKMAEAYLVLGKAEDGLKNFDQALSAYRKYAALRPDSPTASKLRGRFAELEKAAKNQEEEVRRGYAAAQNEYYARKRDPGTAFLLSLLVPGAGQLYDGSPVGGLVCLGVCGTGMFLMVQGSQLTTVHAFDVTNNTYDIAETNVWTNNHAIEFLVGSSLLLLGECVNIPTAIADAEGANKENGFVYRTVFPKEDSVALNPTFGFMPGGIPETGMALALKF